MERGGPLLSPGGSDALVAAIGRAEQGSRGEVRVHIEERCRGDALERARELFGELGMADTARDTGVLLYVAQGSRKVAVWAGEGIHAAADDDFWSGVTNRVASAFGRGAGLDGIVAAVDEIGALLRAHVAGDDDAGNELPNKVTNLMSDDKQIDQEDVDDVIEIATDIAKREEAEASKLDVDDVVDIGRQLGLAEDHVEQAVEELEDREEAEVAAAKARSRTFKIAAAIAGGVFVLLFIWALSGRGALKDELATVKKKRAQVVRVVERQAQVAAQWEGRGDSRDKDAELSGARNRVNIEAKRYDETAAAYNDTADSFPNSLWASVVRSSGAGAPVQRDRPMVKRTAIALAVIACLAGVADAGVPAIETPVTDLYGALNATEAPLLEELLVEHRRKTGVQIAVLVIASTHGEPIEDYSLSVAQKWGGGGKKRSDGILLVLAMTDRRSRIDVGYDLEADLTDSEGRRILDGMKPDLRGGRVAAALTGAVRSIIGQTGGLKPANDWSEKRALTSSSGNRSGSSAESGCDGGGTLVTIIIILGIIIFSFATGGSGGSGGTWTSSGSSWSSSSSSSTSSWSSSSSSSSSGSTSWGGGGGSFGGGGASSGW